MSETVLGITCPFCNGRLKMESYFKKPRSASLIIVFCDNDECKVKPSTIESKPSLAFADVKAWGFKGKEDEQ